MPVDEPEQRGEAAFEDVALFAGWYRWWSDQQTPPVIVECQRACGDEFS